ncbi:MAG TPA: 30S ribosomal protein S20 [Candidatus Saccharimonadales bacterium]
MPIIRSAAKRARQTKIRTARNNIVKRQLKDATRAFEAVIAEKKAAKISDSLSNIQSAVDTAAKKRVISRSRASRIKARYAAMAKTAGGKNPVKSPKKVAAKKPAAKKPVKKAKKP